MQISTGCSAQGVQTPRRSVHDGTQDAQHGHHTFHTCDITQPRAHPLAWCCCSITADNTSCSCMLIVVVVVISPKSSSQRLQGHSQDLAIATACIAVEILVHTPAWQPLQNAAF